MEPLNKVVLGVNSVHSLRRKYRLSVNTIVQNAVWKRKLFSDVMVKYVTEASVIHVGIRKANQTKI